MAQLIVRRPIGVNPGLNFTRIPPSFDALFRESKLQIVDDKRIKLTFLFKLPYLNSNLALTLGNQKPCFEQPRPRLSCGDHGILVITIIYMWKKGGLSLPDVYAIGGSLSIQWCLYRDTDNFEEIKGRGVGTINTDQTTVLEIKATIVLLLFDKTRATRSEFLMQKRGMKAT